MMHSGICFFIGHRDAPSHIYPPLLFQIEKLITEHGVSEFYVGHYGSFDAMVLRALTHLREQYPHIRRIVVTPYHPAQQPTEKPENCDELFYPFDEPVIPRYAIVRANRKMVETCGYLVVYAEHTGKARDFLESARRRESKGLLRVFAVECSWERAMRNMLVTSIRSQVATQCLSPDDIERLEDAGLSSETALLLHCRQEFGDGLSAILDRAENELQWQIGFAQENPGILPAEEAQELLDYQMYLAQLRRREKL